MDTLLLKNIDLELERSLAMHSYIKNIYIRFQRVVVRNIPQAIDEQI